jgi:hypothetical protein
MFTMEAWRLKKEPWRVSRPVVAASLHFYEDPGPRYVKVKNRIRNRIKVKRGIGIRIKAMKIRNLGRHTVPGYILI